MTQMHTQPHETGVAAQVNAPETVVLFDEAGHAMRVNADSVPYWLAKGFVTEQLDPAQAGREFGVAVDALKGAVSAYITEVTAAGQIDHSADSARYAAHLAMREVEHAWHRVERSIDATLPSV